MRRADRLFRIVQFLRAGRLQTAHSLAQKLQVSDRTIYRDVQDLQLSGVPILGEAGVGYTLRRDYDLPPLMFDHREITALVLGSRMVAAWGDAELASAANDALRKIEAVLTPALRDRIDAVPLYVPGYGLRNQALARDTWSSCAAPSKPTASSTSPTAMKKARSPNAACGLWRSSSGARSGLWSPGANCARISAASASTAFKRRRFSRTASFWKPASAMKTLWKR